MPHLSRKVLRFDLRTDSTFVRQPPIWSVEVTLTGHIHPSVGYIPGEPQNFDVLGTAGFGCIALESWWAYIDDVAPAILKEDRLVFDADIFQTKVYSDPVILTYFQGAETGSLRFGGGMDVVYTHEYSDFESTQLYTMSIRYNYHDIPESTTTFALIGGALVSLVMLVQLPRRKPRQGR